MKGNPSLQKLISSGQVQQEKARRLVSAALLAMKRFDANEIKAADALDSLERYEECYDPQGGSHREQYATTLDSRPWKSCACDVCKALGHHVILFRGAERNRRRGLHNTWTFYRRVQRQTAPGPSAPTKTRNALKAASGDTRP